MSNHEIFTTHIGITASGLLDHKETASVLGVTSRGLFLRLSSPWVIFLSMEAQRGPLTLNCPALQCLLDPIAKGEQALIIPGEIIFPARAITIDISQAAIWQAPPLPASILPPDQRFEKLGLVAGLVHARQPASLLAGLLPVLADLEGEHPPSRHALASQIDDLRRLIADHKPGAIAAGLVGFLGLGSGLTPSGDDLILGYLLALARWGCLLSPGLQAGELARELLPLAYHKTTTLSANLLECASQGQADERLLLALDGIFSSLPDAPTCAAVLADWGNTSGHDALVGMALLLQHPRQST